ncbi:hypothetical protein LCGC14_0720470 [marine sediment metagenome]|uniref:Uncharacterized protein n=1 Tax=marine sediment metagenome TaxID=412755 RepID=A0A0F9QGS1_9ZZZZ
MVYTGKGLETYFGIESTWKVGTGFGNSHIPFNPMETVPVPKPIYTQKDYKDAASQVVTEVWDEQLQEQEKEYAMIYKDPFLAMSMFKYKSVTGFGGAGGGINADMRVAGTGPDTLFIQAHIEDKAGINDIDKRLKGGEISSYTLEVDVGDLLRERATIKTYDFAETAETMSCSADFHDERFTALGGWSDWNVKNINGVLFTAVKVRWGDAVLSGLNIKKKSMTIALNKESTHTSESLVASEHWEGDYLWSVEVSGVLSTDALILETEKAIGDKLKQDLDFYIDMDANEEEFYKMTNMMIESVESDDMSKASEAKEVTVKFRMYKNSVITYSGLFEEQTDPLSKINE